MLVVLFIIGLSLILYGLILSYGALKKRHRFIVYRDEKNQFKVLLIHLNTLNFFKPEAYRKTSLFRFTLKSYFHYLMYQFENETEIKDLLKIFKKQQEKNKAKIIKIFNR
nr:MAG: hypothetical protein [Bacteriophage sp.]